MHNITILWQHNENKCLEEIKNKSYLCATPNEKPSNYVTMFQNAIAEAMKLNPAAVKPNSINELYLLSLVL